MLRTGTDWTDSGESSGKPISRSDAENAENRKCISPLRSLRLGEKSLP